MRSWTAVALLCTGLAAFGCNQNSLQGTQPHIVVDPPEVDFGRVEQGTPGPGSVFITNTGSQPLEVRRFEVVPPGVFEVADPVVSPEAPVTLGPNDVVEVQLAFVPSGPGPTAAKLQIFNNDPAEPVVTVDLGGLGFRVNTDYFTQPGLVDQADILFVVDNSGSMGDDQVKLGNAFDTFINWISDTIVDYRIAVTTTDTSDFVTAGVFHGSPAVLDPSTPNLKEAFASNVQVGTTGAFVERGFQAAALAFSDDNLAGPNANFLRDDARLYIVFVSDEDDQSGESVYWYIDYFADLKGGRDRIYFASISGPPGSGCETAAAGTRYYSIAYTADGFWGSICQPNFGYQLLQLGFAVSGLYGQFSLTQPATPGTLEVYVDDVLLEYGVDWELNESNNAVKFYPASIPAAGSTIKVVYEVDTPS